MQVTALTGPSLRRRLVMLTAVAILPLALMAGAGLYVLARQHDVQAERVGLELARSVANAVNTELDRAITVLQTLATTTTLDQGDLTAFRDRAGRVFREQPLWAAILLAGPSGARLVDTRLDGSVVMSPTLDPESFRRVVALRQPAVGSLINQSGVGWVFPVRVPIVRDGSLKYVLTALVKPETIHRVLTRQHIPDDWVISIVDSQGARVGRSRAHEENLGGRLAPSAAALIARGGTEGFAITQALEGDRLYTPFSRLEPSGWIAVIGIPTSAVQAAAWRSVAAYGAGILLSIGLGTLAAFAVARGITGPMRKLRAAAEAMGRGETPSAPRTPIAEIRDVGTALAAAAAQLQGIEREREELLWNERQARESAERASRAKEEFMAVLSHELRTPLNAVYGWARLLQNDAVRDPALIARAKDAIVRNADAQVRLIDELLDLARITSGKIQLHVRPVQMSEVLSSAVDAVRPSADAKRITIATRFDPDAGLVLGDADRLRQIVWNLLVNAVKFTGDGGTVTLTLESGDGQLRVIVSDNGQGIAPQLMPELFERFRQADSSSTRTFGGLGLGLALVKQLTELHGGSVEAASAGEDRGATFTVVLPAASDTVENQAATTTPAPIGDAALATAVRLDGLRVLVADNEPDALTLTETILSASGAVVRTCESAALALRLLREWEPAVLISDIEMPGEDGYSLMRKIRALPPDEGGQIPAVALSAYGRPEDRSRAISAGFNMHVPKPVDPGELTAIVAAVAGYATAPRA